ncbi:MAG: heavy metal-binding domain-containing protein [Ginsengibacter sp.]
MKTNILIIMLISLLVTGFFACNNSETQTDNSTTQTDTLGMRKVMGTDEMYTCTMHNEVMSEKPGKCPKCEMNLVKQKMTDAQMKMMKEGTYVKPKE